MHDALLEFWMLAVAAYIVVPVLGLIAATHIVFHTWRRLERKHPSVPSPPPSTV
jgi:hypothetical protein